MRTEIIDLYKHYAKEAPEGATGTLSCWMYKTSDRVSPGRKKPAVLIMPGGGYSHVSAREADPVALRFAVRGYAIFILNYSCAPLHFPVALREAAMAMRYIREHAAEFEVDPNMNGTVVAAPPGESSDDLIAVVNEVIEELAAQNKFEEWEQFYKDYAAQLGIE